MILTDCERGLCFGLPWPLWLHRNGWALENRKIEVLAQCGQKLTYFQRFRRLKIESSLMSAVYDILPEGAGLELAELQGVVQCYLSQ